MKKPTRQILISCEALNNHEIHSYKWQQEEEWKIDSDEKEWDKTRKIRSVEESLRDLALEGSPIKRKEDEVFEKTEVGERNYGIELEIENWNRRLKWRHYRWFSKNIYDLFSRFIELRQFF